LTASVKAAHKCATHCIFQFFFILLFSQDVIQYIYLVGHPHSYESDKVNRQISALLHNYMRCRPILHNHTGWPKIVSHHFFQICIFHRTRT